MSKFTSFLSRSATPTTAFTAISAILRLSTLIILELRVVMAVIMSGSRLSLEKGTVSAISAKCWMAISAAFSNPSAIRTGWIPRLKSFSACSRRAPASTTTPVVPSPISSSWDWDNSTSSLATWWLTSIRSMIVAPSFVMVTSPSAETRILSIPLGPRDVRTIWEIDFAARMFALVASRPLTLDFACCSFRMTKGLPYSSNVIERGWYQLTGGV